MTVKELSIYLGIPSYTIYYQAEVGNLPGHKVGGGWRFKKREIDEWKKGKAPLSPGRDKRGPGERNPLAE